MPPFLCFGRLEMRHFVVTLRPFDTRTSPFCNARRGVSRCKKGVFVMRKAPASHSAAIAAHTHGRCHTHRATVATHTCGRCRTMTNGWFLHDKNRQMTPQTAPEDKKKRKPALAGFLEYPLRNVRFLTVIRRSCRSQSCRPPHRDCATGRAQSSPSSEVRRDNTRSLRVLHAA